MSVLKSGNSWRLLYPLHPVSPPYGTPPAALPVARLIAAPSPPSLYDTPMMQPGSEALAAVLTASTTLTSLTYAVAWNCYRMADWRTTACVSVALMLPALQCLRRHWWATRRSPTSGLPAHAARFRASLIASQLACLP